MLTSYIIGIVHVLERHGMNSRYLYSSNSRSVRLILSTLNVPVNEE